MLSVINPEKCTFGAVQTSAGIKWKWVAGSGLEFLTYTYWHLSFQWAIENSGLMPGGNGRYC